MNADGEERLEELEQRVTVLEDDFEFRLGELEERVTQLEDGTKDVGELRRELEVLKAELGE